MLRGFGISMRARYDRDYTRSHFEKSTPSMISHNAAAAAGRTVSFHVLLEALRTGDILISEDDRDLYRRSAVRLEHPAFLYTFLLILIRSSQVMVLQYCLSVDFIEHTLSPVQRPWT